MDRTPGCMLQFFRYRFKLWSEYMFLKRTPMRLTWRGNELREYIQADRCYLCCQLFDPGNPKKIKVKDHCHWTGQFRGAACATCNGDCQNPKDILIFHHNFARYDGHGVMKAIMRLRNPAGMGEQTIREFLGEQETTENATGTRSLRIYR